MYNTKTKTMFITYNAKTNKLTVESDAPEGVPHLYILDVGELDTFSVQIKANGITNPPTINIELSPPGGYAAHQAELDRFFTFTRGVQTENKVKEFVLNGYHIKTTKCPYVGMGYHMWLDLERIPVVVEKKPRKQMTPEAKAAAAQKRANTIAAKKAAATI